ncbi:MFS transporter [Nocardia salmonicida]|uniref:Putative MFS family arabinose efflux permease n=1 Tax=Nocardia fluminea TaxID=134984 RepID=A0A2N3VHB2_9NOCA|nr:MFS transporter [Nocardia fluminea]PKV80986.1 putative MFS family arabinose efflux permease [Nocardia fluminea]
MTRAPLAPTPTTQAARGNQIYAVAGCYFVASFAALGLPPYLTTILPELGDPTARWAGVLYVVPTVFGGLGAPLWGRLADRYGQKRLLLRAQLGLAAAFLLAGWADSLPMFAVALILQGVLGGTFAASSGYLGASLNGPALARALTVLQGSARLALVIAPIAVGALSPWLSPHRQYLVLALLPLAAALMLAFLPEPTAGVDESSRAAPRSETGDTHSLRALFALEFGFVFATVVSFPYLQALIEQRLPDTPVLVVGVLFAVPHLVYLATATTAQRVVRLDTSSLVIIGFGCLALGSAAHLWADSLTELVLIRVLLGVGLTLCLLGRNALAARCASRRPAGRMFGSLEFFAKAGAVAAGLTATVVNLEFGPAAPALAGAIVAAAALSITTGAVLRTRNAVH